MMIRINFFPLLFILHTVYVCPITSSVDTFTTIANASHFYFLENLIGSIHTYAPAHLAIQVGDAGLTPGQFRLLSLYRNVQVISMEMAKQIEKRVEVTDELVDYENERYISRLGNTQNGPFETWPYIDSIRKESRLAVVIPFIRSQLSSLSSQLNLSSVFTPCRSLAPVDLVFYHNEERSSSLQSLVLRMIEPFDRIIRRCYGRVRVLAANLTGTDDLYFRGSAMMWQKLIDDKDEVSLSALGYTHFFIMEADASPIRLYWLDAIREQIVGGRNEQHLDTSWWMTGSIYRGPLDVGAVYAHINGNGLYHLSSNFIVFVRFFWRIYLQSGSVGYDYAMTYLLSHAPRHTAVWKSVSHKFRYSDFIQNCWHTGCEPNEKKFALDNPQTYLIHGGARSTNRFSFQSDAEASLMNPLPSTSSTLQLLIVLAIFLCVFPATAMFLCMVLRRRWRYYGLIHRFQLHHFFRPNRELRRLIGNSSWRWALGSLKEVFDFCPEIVEKGEKVGQPSWWCGLSRRFTGNRRNLAEESSTRSKLL